MIILHFDFYNRSRLSGRTRQQRTANDSIRKTDAYQQNTWRIILQPDFTQSQDYKDFDEISATSFWRIGKLRYVTKTYTLTVCFSRTTATLTLLEETFSNLLKLTQRAGRTQYLLLQYCTLHQGHFWDHLTVLIALKHPCSPQTYNYVKTLTG